MQEAHLEGEARLAKDCYHSWKYLALALAASTGRQGLT